MPGTINPRRLVAVALLIALARTTPPVRAAETWPFDLGTTGNDVHWTSATAVDPTADAYDLRWEITLVEVTVRYLFVNYTLNVTNQIPPEQRVGTRFVYGPPPVEVFSGHVVYPDPPAPPAVAAHVRIRLLADGRGHVAVTNVVLGTAQVEIPPFGLVTVSVRRVRLAGTVWAAAVDLTPGDLNCDGAVDFDDIDAFVLSLTGRAAYEAAFPSCRWHHGDINRDGDVTFDDIDPFVALLSGGA